MELVFTWYFNHTMKLSFNGDIKDKVNFQVHTGPALGAFNQWVKGTKLEKWQNRQVGVISKKLISEAASLIQDKTQKYLI
jgi:trans-AT polyketide synthase/acyltransferase/oxidoreductase domain-containing protein